MTYETAESKNKLDKAIADIDRVLERLAEGRAKVYEIAVSNKTRVSDRHRKAVAR